MREINDTEMKQLLLLMMDDIHAFCEKNGIRYCLAYGTMLGAVRHKGFIPWDDDVDLVMPREDYDRFTKLYKSDRYRFLTHDKEPGYLYPFGKVVDTHTTLHEPSHYDYPDMGVYIDVFPLDGLPADEKKRLAHTGRANRLAHLYTLKALSLDYPMSFLLRARYVAVQCALALYPIRRLIRAEMKLARKYPYDASDMVSSLVIRHSYSSGATPRAYYDELIPTEFEGRSFPIPKEYDAYLTSMYGDYMTPPPEAKRTTHHYFTAKWKDNA